MDLAVAHWLVDTLRAYPELAVFFETRPLRGGR